MRLKQEIVLGVGGWRLLRALGLRPEVCHLNEGHAAFATLERARCYMEDHKKPFDRNFHFGFTTRTSIRAVASAESVSCIRFHPKGSGRPERAVSGTQSRVSLCFQAIFLTPLRQLPSFVQIGFALPPHAIIRLAPAEPRCAAACFQTGAASDGSLPTIVVAGMLYQPAAGLHQPLL